MTTTEKKKEGTRSWTPEEVKLLDQIIELISARAENGYPDSADYGTVTVELEDGSNSSEDDGEDVLDMSLGDFVDELIEELESIKDNGATFMSYAISEAKGDVSGMMGLTEE